MVGRLIQKQDVCAGDHHLGEQAAYALSSGENIQMLYTVLTGEKHTSKESADVSSVLDLGKLSQPVNDCQVRIKLFRAVLRKVCLRSCNAPFVSTLIRLHFTHQNFEEGCLCELVSADKCNLVVVTEREGDIVKDLYTIDRLGEVLDHEHLIPNLAVRAEVDVRIFAAGRFNLVKLDFFKCTLSGSCLFGFGSVRGEAGDKVLQLLDFLFLFLVCFLHLADQQLAGLVPEIIVSCIELNFAIVDVGDLCAHLI